jgi:hypothetical protein
MKILIALLSVMLAQDTAPMDRAMQTVRAALAPGLPFPDSDAFGSVPASNNTDALWMVKPLQPGDTAIEVIANPLNELNQLKATRAMAQIQNNIEAAQRKADNQYERALAEARRTGKSQDVDGVTLSDEGVAGAKIDAESHLDIDVAFHEAAYKVNIATSIQPETSRTVMIPGAVVIAAPSNVYKDERLGGERYAEGETLVFLGPITPQVTKRGNDLFEVSAAGTQGLILRLRGNESLMADLLRKTNWNQLLELLK